MTAHDHREYVPGCVRCDLSRDEVRRNDENNALLALIGEPVRAYPTIWTLQQWWEWHARLLRAVAPASTPEEGQQ